MSSVIVKHGGERLNTIMQKHSEPGGLGVHQLLVQYINSRSSPTHQATIIYYQRHGLDSLHVPSVCENCVHNFFFLFFFQKDGSFCMINSTCELYDLGGRY